MTKVSTYFHSLGRFYLNHGCFILFRFFILFLLLNFLFGFTTIDSLFVPVFDSDTIKSEHIAQAHTDGGEAEEEI